jgi:hypothetical protein
MKASKSIISEGIFSTMLGAYRDYKDATGGEKEMRLDKRILQEVAYKGFQDLSQRLKSAGIDLNNAAAIREPRTQDIIRDNTIKYVEQYMSGGEYAERQAAIIGELQKATKANTLKIPTEWNKKTLFDYFLQAATIRANVLVALDKELNYKQDNYGVKKLQDLISEKELKPNTEIQLSGVDILGINTNIVIRNVDNQVVVYSSTDIPKPPNPDGTPGDPNSKENIVPHGSMFKIVHPVALNAIYEEYKSAGGPPPTDVVDLQNAQKMRELQNSLEDNQEIEFVYSTVKVIIRKNDVYISKYLGVPTTKMPEKVSVPPHGDMFQVQRDQNLAFLYTQYLRQPATPVPTEFEAETLE